MLAWEDSCLCLSKYLHVQEYIVNKLQKQLERLAKEKAALQKEKCELQRQVCHNHLCKSAVWSVYSQKALRHAGLAACVS